MQDNPSWHRVVDQKNTGKCPIHGEVFFLKSNQDGRDYCSRCIAEGIAEWKRRYIEKKKR